MFLYRWAYVAACRGPQHAATVRPAGAEGQCDRGVKVVCGSFGYAACLCQRQAQENGDKLKHALTKLMRLRQDEENASRKRECKEERMNAEP